MARNIVIVMADAIVARLHAAMPELRGTLAASRRPPRYRPGTPRRPSVVASAMAATIADRLAASPHAAPSAGPFSQTVGQIASAIVAQMAPARRDDLPLEKIEI